MLLTVIIDFGLAQQVDSEEYSTYVCGTPGYAAPEILNYQVAKEKYGVACDMFSLGVIYHVL